MLDQIKPTKRTPGGPRPRPNMDLLRLRIQRGLSRDEVGRMAGITGKQVGLIERGVAKRPRETTMSGIADALGTEPLDLFPIRTRI